MGAVSGLRLKARLGCSRRWRERRQPLHACLGPWTPKAAGGTVAEVRRWDASGDPQQVVAEGLAEVQQGWSGSRVWVVAPGLSCPGFWGLARTVQQERPELGLRLVEVDGEVDGALLEQVLRNRGRARGAAERCGATVPRLVRAPAEGEWTTSADGCWLVTGGTGLLGQATARWLKSRGARG